MQSWKRGRWPWESLRITPSRGTGFCCKSAPCLLAVTLKWTMKQRCWRSGFNSASTVSRGLVIAMVISLIFIVLLRFLAGIMVWVMIVLVILVIGYGTPSASVGFKMSYFTSKQRTIYVLFFRDFPLLHGVCQSERPARFWRHHPWPGPADRLCCVPAD